jgi:hypothetical protein
MNLSNEQIMACGLVVLVVAVAVWWYWSGGKKEHYTFLTPTKDASRELWAQNARLNRKFILGYLDRTREFPQIVSDMAANREELANLYGKAVPKSAGPMKMFLDTLYEGLDLRLNNINARLDSKLLLYNVYQMVDRTSEEIASALGLSPIIVAQLLRNYVSMTMEELRLHIVGEHKKEREVYDDMVQQAMGMSDYLSSKA